MSLFDSITEWFAHLFEDDDYHTARVEKGDSLWSIAERLTAKGIMKKVPGEADGMNWKRIADANPDHHWTQDHLIQPGEVLRIPKD